MSSDVIPVLSFVPNALLVTPTKTINVVPRAESLEVAASALSRAAPPTSVKCAVVVMHSDFRLRQNAVAALRKAGYIHIEAIDVRSIVLSETILNLPLNTTGQVVFILIGLECGLPLAECMVDVIKKVEAGWQVVQTLEDLSTVLAQHPFVGDVVIHSETPDSVKAEVMKLFPFVKVHLSPMGQANFNETFIRNRVNKGNLNGYEVLPFFRFNLLIKYGEKVEKVAMQGREIPLVITKEIHIGTSDSIEVCIDDVPQTLLKSYSLHPESRTVSITISVDKTLIPSVIIQSVQRSVPTSHRENRSPVKLATACTALRWTPTYKSCEFVYGTPSKKAQSCPSGPPSKSVAGAMDSSTVSPPTERVARTPQMTPNDEKVLSKGLSSATPATNAPSQVPLFDLSRTRSTIIPTPATQIPPMNPMVPEHTASQASPVALATSTKNAPVFNFSATFKHDSTFNFGGNQPALRWHPRSTVSTQKSLKSVPTTAAVSNINFSPLQNPFLLPEVALLLRTAPTLKTSPPVPVTDQPALPKIASETNVVVQRPPAKAASKAALGTVKTANVNVHPSPATSSINAHPEMAVEDQPGLPKFVPVQPSSATLTTKTVSSAAGSNTDTSLATKTLVPQMAPTTSNINVPLPQKAVTTDQLTLPKVVKTVVNVQPSPTPSTAKCVEKVIKVDTVKPMSADRTVLSQVNAKPLPSLATKTPAVQASATSVTVPLQEKMALKVQPVLPTVVPKPTPLPTTLVTKAVPQASETSTVKSTFASANGTVLPQVNATTPLPKVTTKSTAFAAYVAQLTAGITAPGPPPVSVKNEPAVPQVAPKSTAAQASGAQPSLAASTAKTVHQLQLPAVSTVPKPVPLAAETPVRATSAASKTNTSPPKLVKTQPVLPEVAPKTASLVTSTAKAIPANEAKSLPPATQTAPANSKADHPSLPVKDQPVVPKVAPNETVAPISVVNSSPAACAVKTIPQSDAAMPVSLATKTPTPQVTPAASDPPLPPPAPVKIQPTLPKVVPKTTTNQTSVANPTPITSTVKSSPQTVEKPLPTKTSAAQTTPASSRVSVSTQASMTSEPEKVDPKTTMDKTLVISPTARLPSKTTSSATATQATRTSIATQTSTTNNAGSQTSLNDSKDSGKPVPVKTVSSDAIEPVGDTAPPQASKASPTASTAPVSAQTTQKPAPAPVKTPVESVRKEERQVNTPAFPAAHTLEPKSVVCAVIDAPNGFVFDAYLKDESRYETKLATVADVIAHMKKTVPTGVVAAIFFTYDKAALTTLGEFRDACRDAKYCKVRFIPYKSIYISIAFKLAGFHIRQGKYGVAVTNDAYFKLQRSGRQLHIFCEGKLDKAQPCSVDFVVVQNTGNTMKTCLNKVRDIFRSPKFHVITELDNWEACRAKYFRSFVDTTLNFGNYLCNDFCDFGFTIQDKDVAHDYRTYNQSMPFTVKYNFPVTDTTLPVYAKRNSMANDLLKTFTVPSDAKAVELVICVTSPCDIDLKMTYLDKAKKKNVAAVEAVRELVNANPQSDAENCSAELPDATKASATATLKPGSKDEPSRPPTTVAKPVQKSGGCPSCKRCCYGQPSSACIPKKVDPPASTKSATAELPVSAKAIEAAKTKPCSEISSPTTAVAPTKSDPESKDGTSFPPRTTEAISPKMPVAPKAIPTKPEPQDAPSSVLSSPMKAVSHVKSNPESKHPPCSPNLLPAPKAVPRAATKPQPTDPSSPELSKANVATTPKPESEDDRSLMSSLPTKVVEMTLKAIAERCESESIGKSVPGPEKKVRTRARSCPPQLLATTTTVASAKTVPPPTNAVLSEEDAKAVASAVSSLNDGLTKTLAALTSVADKQEIDFKMNKASRQAFFKAYKALCKEEDEDYASELSFAETISVTWPPLTSTSNKKSRSQRRKLAQLHAVKNATADEPSKPADLPPIIEDEVQKVASFLTLPVEQFQLEFDSSPTAILTFTSDNRVLIEAGETYTGVKELLAYVRLRSGKMPQVGRQAFDALKKHPGSVFYDITRLLALDFDPSHADPTWTFKTTRGANGKLLISGGDNVKTLPNVLFGLVVRSTLLYIQGHLNAVIAAAGIRLPWGSAISDEDLEAVSKQIGTKLVIVEDEF